MLSYELQKLVIEQNEYLNEQIAEAIDDSLIPKEHHAMVRQICRMVAGIKGNQTRELLTIIQKDLETKALLTDHANSR